MSSYSCAINATRSSRGVGQIIQRQWRSGHLAWSIEYTKRLEEKGRFQLCIWPEHCLIGTPGHNVVKSVRDAIDEWSDKTGRSVEWVEKGQNLLTEMYSALCAEVPVNEKTSFNTVLLDSVSGSLSNLENARAIFCVNNHSVSLTS